MAKKKTDAQEQTEEKKVKNPAAEKNEQPVKEQPKAEKQDGAWVSQVKDKNGQPVPGIYMIYLRENGELRKPVRLTVEERDAFFQGTKDMTKEEKNKVFNERALELAKVKFAPTAFITGISWRYQVARKRRYMSLRWCRTERLP